MRMGSSKNLLMVNVLAETLAAACFDHELSCQVVDWLRFEWLYNDALVEWIAWDNLESREEGR